MRALIIEDDQNLGLSIKKEIEKQAYTVDLERDGNDGSFRARTNNYDLIILDLVLPSLNGHKVLSEIREDGKTSVIIAISYYDKIEDRLALLNLGADDYLAKPFNMSELIARIKANTRRKDSKILPKILNYSNLKMNLNTFEVFRDSKKLNLTKKEFCLLKLFILNPNEVMSRDIIMERVWDANSDSFSNTVETHIMRLRKKTEKYGKRLIHTINGYGYKFD